jgi:hypothetical protein
MVRIAVINVCLAIQTSEITTIEFLSILSEFCIAGLCGLLQLSGSVSYGLLDVEY